MNLRERLIACLCAVVGAGAAVGMAACGDDERGGVEVEGTTTAPGGATAGTDTVGTDTTGPVGTDTVGTDTVGTDTTGTDTAP